MSHNSPMNILAISGSLRAGSVNTALLQALQGVAVPPVRVRIWEGLAALPIFSADLEGALTPEAVIRFAAEVAGADAIVIACPEYARTIPGEMKNAIDWLVSRDEVVAKPIALLHASHRGDEMLEHLRRVLETVSSRFTRDIFARVPLPSRMPEAVPGILAEAGVQAILRRFLAELQGFARGWV